MTTDTLLRIGAVCDRTSLSERRIYELIRDGKFPVQVRIDGAVRWSEQEVSEWIEARKSERRTA